MNCIKSVMVEGGGDALRTMEAYIDSNTVHAGLVVGLKGLPLLW